MKKWFVLAFFTTLAAVLIWIGMPAVMRYDLVASEWASPVPTIRIFLYVLCYLGGMAVFLLGVLIFMVLWEREPSDKVSSFTL